MLAAPRMPKRIALGVFAASGGDSRACQLRWTKPNMDVILKTVGFSVQVENESR